MVDGHEIIVGKLEWVQNQTVVDHKPLSRDEENCFNKAREITLSNKTVVATAVDGRFAGFFTLADSEKDGAAAAIARLKSSGVKTVMLTGDNEASARAIAEKVGIERVIAGVLPDRKEAVVAEESERNGPVAMVGDGINDAPALARADVGVAIGTGADVAIEASDVTLIRGDLEGVGRAIALSKATMRTIKQNLFWAFFYNLALVPAAAGVFAGVTWLPAFITNLHPATAAGAMALSSVTVVSNSLRLARRQL